MMTRPRRARSLIAITLFFTIPVELLSAEVIVVDLGGGGDHTQIQPAVNAAGNGDVILVEPGTYAPFTIDHKELSVLGDGSPVIVDGGITVRNTLEYHPVLLAGLESHGFKHANGDVDPALRLSVTRAAVRVENCTLIGTDGIYCDWCNPPDLYAGGEAVRINIALDVVFTRCTIRGGRGYVWFDGEELNRGGDGILATGCSLAIHDSTVEGRDGPSAINWDLGQGGDGGDAVYVTEHSTVPSVVHVAGSVLAGGDGGDGDICLDNAGKGGDGLKLEGATTRGYTLDVQLSGGQEGCGWNYPPPGSALVLLNGATLTPWPGTARSLATDSPVREQELVLHRFEGEPGDLVFLLEAPFSGFELLPAASGVMLLHYPGLQRFRYQGRLTPGGFLDLWITTPDLPGVREARRTWTQSFFRVGVGDCLLGSGSTRVVVDSAF